MSLGWGGNVPQIIFIWPVNIYYNKLVLFFDYLCIPSLKRNYADKGGWLEFKLYEYIASLQYFLLRAENISQNVLFDANTGVAYRLNDVRNSLRSRHVRLSLQTKPKIRCNPDILGTHFQAESGRRELRKCIFSETDYVSHSCSTKQYDLNG